MNPSSTSVPGQSAEELIAIAEAHGFPVSKRQLAEWHRAGYLPTPQVLPRPRGTGRGKISIYPLGTSDQLLAYCQAHQKKRRLPDAAWKLWWEEGGVPGGPVRSFLQRVAGTWAKRKEIILGAYVDEVKPGDEVSEEAEDYLLDRIDTAFMVRKLPPIVAQSRKRFRDGRFLTFMHILLDVGTGMFNAYKFDSMRNMSDDRRIVDTGLGLGTIHTPRKKSPYKPAKRTSSAVSVDIDSEASLTQLMHLSEDHAMEREAELTTDEELMQAREEVRTLLGFAETFGPISEQVMGRGIFGFAALAQAVPMLRPFEQGMLVLVWRALRRAGFSSNMDNLLAAMRQWNEVWLPTFQHLQQLRSEVPAFSEILAPRQTGKALRSERAMQHLLGRLQILYTQHQEEVQAFAARQPWHVPTLSEDGPSEPASTRSASASSNE